MSENDALNLVDQLLNNEKEDKPAATKKVIKKKKPEAADVYGNPGYDPDKPEEYWPGDTLNISKADMERARLPEKAFIVVVRTPTSVSEASVYCPWYSIHGWGASTMDAVENCVANIENYWKRFPEKAQELVANFKGYKPKKKKLKNLQKKKEDESVAEILMDEGL